MIPCQKTCDHYCPGCHLSCRDWAEFLEAQAFQHQLKKQYLRFYTELCASRTRQFRQLAPLR